MIRQIESIMGTSTYLAEDNWNNVNQEIQNTLNEWRLDGTETLYIIYDEDIPQIIATSSKIRIR